MDALGGDTVSERFNGFSRLFPRIFSTLENEAKYRCCFLNNDRGGADGGTPLGEGGRLASLLSIVVCEESLECERDGAGLGGAVEECGGREYVRMSGTEPRWW